MKIRNALAALAAVATLTLTACGSEIAGTAAPAAGADRVVPATSADGTDTNGTDTDGANTTEEAPTDESTTGDAPTDDPSTEDTSTEDTSTEDTSTEDTSTDGEPGGDSTVAAKADACEQLLTLAQNFSSKIIQKAAQGGVTQADVDAVFSDENMKALPQELQTDAAKLKDLSQQMVGKKITDLTEILPKVQTTFQSIVDKAETFC